MMARALRCIGLPLRCASVSFASTLLLSLTACGTAPPKLKQGLWQVQGQSVEKPSGAKNEFRYQLCRDHAFDAAQDAQLKSVKGCNTVVKNLGDGQFKSASNCNVDATLIGSNGTTVFKKDTATHSETHATYAPPLQGKAEETMTEDQQYLGACPRGMRPGDTLTPDGIVRHHN